MVSTYMLILGVEVSYPFSLAEKHLERTIQYRKDRTESFDYYYLPYNRIK